MSGTTTSTPLTKYRLITPKKKLLTDIGNYRTTFSVS
jgi:hypothetical protein